MTRVAEALAALEEKGEARIRDGLSRYGIVTADRVIGVPMAAIQKVAKAYRRDPPPVMGLDPRQTRSITVAMPWPTPMHIVHKA